MLSDLPQIPFMLLLTGFLVFLSIFAKGACTKIKLPPLLVYICLGVFLKGLDEKYHILEGEHDLFRFLGMLGVLVLLFDVGLGSNLKGLIEKLRGASLVWLGNVAVCLAGGWILARLFLDMEVLASLFLATAFTATSVGVAAEIWRSKGKLDSEDGRLLMDVAEMDDISGVLMMTVLFAIAPLFQGDKEAITFSSVALPGLKALGIFALFAFACYLFACFMEPHLTRFSEKLPGKSTPVLIIAGMAIILASLAGLLGLSVAIGAFLAGLSYSRDPEAVGMRDSFDILRDMFAPFFFIHIGMKMQPSALGAAWQLGILLLVVAVLVKLVGSGLPSLVFTSWKSSLLIGISMIPRAEITLIIMNKGHNLGEWAVSDRLFNAIVLVSFGTCLLAPLILQPLLPQGKKSGS
ncbi:MAG: cation:proton antiporter [Candidatus Sumerlaeia bacterium]